MYVRGRKEAVNWPPDNRLKMYDGNSHCIQLNRSCVCTPNHNSAGTQWRKDVSSSSGGCFFLRVNVIIIVCANKRAMPHLLYRFQFQRSYNVGAFFLSFFFLFLIFVFTVHLSEGLRLTMQWCNGSFCVCFIVVVTWWLWICSCYADLRMIKQSL